MAKKQFRTIQQHFWEYAQHTLLICGVMFILPFLLSLLGLGRKNMILLTLGIVALFLLVWGVTLLRGVRFLLILHGQIKRGLPFETGPLKRLDAVYTSSWLSESWLTHTGYIALHRSQIADVTYALPRVDRAYPGGLVDLIITTVQGRRYHCRMTGASVKMVIKWHQRSAAKEELTC